VPHTTWIALSAREIGDAKHSAAGDRLGNSDVGIYVGGNDTGWVVTGNLIHDLVKGFSSMSHCSTCKFR
jgi:hypothetical protein